MGIKVLVAEPNQILRAGLRVLVAENANVAQVYEASNEANLTRQLLSLHIDFLLINQQLITNIAAFSLGEFIVLAAEPDIATLKKAYLHGARGYLSISASPKILQRLLEPEQRMFTLDPLFIPWAMEYLFRSPLACIKESLLTPREREIVDLLRAGYDRPKIASILSISESTLKTHIKHISHKRETEPANYLETQVLGSTRSAPVIEHKLQEMA
ncbi:MAG TPA: LuxR C-terminal-related transcriptional regulator [Ktedonobacteraceae bacterium]|nr:LuxR C-terminal-related transcriptional regulator [Ktedonobacteraceae bacterium]